MRYYHVDRLSTLTEGQIIQLVKWDDIDPPELQNQADILFPDGVSYHGNCYMLSSDWALQSNPNNRDPKTIEIIYEYIRRSNFTDKPSRFQSFFALNTMDQVKRFKDKYDIHNSSVWVVESDSVFKADMNLLSLGSSPLACTYLAHKYWQGEAGFDPNPFWEYLLKLPVTVLEKIE